MKTRFLLKTSVVLLISFVLAGCGNKEKQAKIDELTEQLDVSRQSQVKDERRLEEERKKVDELRESKGDLERELKALSSRISSMERELERYKDREEMAKKEEEQEPSMKEKVAAAKLEAPKLVPAMVTIAGEKSSGSGVLVSADEKTWIYFPASLLQGQSRLEVTMADGTRIEKFGDFEFASDADLGRLEVEDKVGLALTPSKNTAIKSGTSLLGFGKANAILEGRAVGGEATVMKADSRFRDSVAGTPVLFGETAELVGIVLDERQNVRELWPQSRRSTYTVREICRLDRPIKWKSLPIASLMEESRSIESADRLTRLVLAFAATSYSATGIDMNSRVGGSKSAGEIFEESKTVAVVRALFDLDEWLKERGERSSKADLNRRVLGVYQDVLRLSSRNTDAFEGKGFSDYHAEAAAQSLAWRKDAEKEIAAKIAGFE